MLQMYFVISGPLQGTLHATHSHPRTHLRTTHAHPRTRLRTTHACYVPRDLSTNFSRSRMSSTVSAAAHAGSLPVKVKYMKLEPRSASETSLRAATDPIGK